jgi:hypothetical protein
MAHDAAFVAGIRQVRDDVLGLICDGNMLRSEISDQRWHQFDFEGHSCLECGQQPSGLLRIVQHQRTASTIEPSDSAIANDREYGSTEPFSMRCTPVIPTPGLTISTPVPYGLFVAGRFVRNLDPGSCISQAEPSFNDRGCNHPSGFPDPAPLAPSSHHSGGFWFWPGSERVHPSSHVTGPCLMFRINRILIIVSVLDAQFRP